MKVLPLKNFLINPLIHLFLLPIFHTEISRVNMSGEDGGDGSGKYTYGGGNGGGGGGGKKLWPAILKGIELVRSIINGTRNCFACKFTAYELDDWQLPLNRSIEAKLAYVCVTHNSHSPNLTIKTVIISLCTPFIMNIVFIKLYIQHIHIALA